MPRIVREKQRRTGEKRTQSAFQNECQYDLTRIIHEWLQGRLAPAS